MRLFFNILFFCVLMFTAPSFTEADAPQTDIVSQTLDVLEYQSDGAVVMAAAGSGAAEAPVPAESRHDDSRLSGLGIEPLIDVIDLEDENLGTALDLIALKTGLDIVYDAGIQGTVTLALKNIDVWDLLKIILDINGMNYLQSDGVVRVLPREEWLALTEGRSGADVRAAIFRLTNGRPVDVIAEAEKIEGRKGKLFRDAYHRSVVVMDTPEIIKGVEAIVRRVDVPVVTELLPIPAAADILKLKNDVEKLVTTVSGRFEINEQTRTLTVTDVPEKMAAYRDLVRQLQVPAKIKMRVKIIGILLNDEHKDGVDWEAIVSKYMSIKVKGDLRDSGPDKTLSVSTGALSDEDIKVLLDALDTVGTMTVFTEGEADMTSEDINRLTMDWHNTFVTGAQEAIDRMNVMVMDMRLVPSDPLLKISLNASFLPPAHGYFQDTTPSVQRQEGPETFAAMPSVVEVSGGETIVLGGILESVVVDQEKRLPLLGQIPFVGQVFFATQIQKEYMVETVIFLTPVFAAGKGGS